MKTKCIPSFYSIVLTLLAAAACGYLNKEKLTMKNAARTTDKKVLNITGLPNQESALNNPLNKKNEFPHWDVKTGFWRNAPTRLTAGN